MFGVVWDYYSSKLKGKQYKQNTTPKSYKTEIKIIANPGLALSGFEQSGLGRQVTVWIKGLVGMKILGWVVKWPLDIRNNMTNIYNKANRVTRWLYFYNCKIPLLWNMAWLMKHEWLATHGSSCLCNLQTKSGHQLTRRGKYTELVELCLPCCSRLVAAHPQWTWPPDPKEHIRTEILGLESTLQLYSGLSTLRTHQCNTEQHSNLDCLNQILKPHSVGRCNTQVNRAF